jgi:hypothetical protein
MDLFEKFPPPKKKQPPGINQCGVIPKGGGYYIPVGFVDYPPSSRQFEVDI